MDRRSSSLDWSLLQALVAVAEAGSLSAAGRRLGLSQPTLGRQIRALEEELGVVLFQRRARGLALTEAGHDLLPSAKAMQEAAGQLELAAAGRSADMAGTVRLTASLVVSLHILPGLIAGIRRSNPEIQIDLVPSDLSQNLLFREADIAIRMYRPEQLDIVTQYLGEVEIGFFAARSYLDRRGRPAHAEDLRDFDLVGYDADQAILRGMRELGLPAERDWFAVRSDDHNVLLELVRSGCGLGLAQVRIADRDPDLERVLPDLPLPTLPVWLTAPEAMRRTPRIRRVWDHLAEGLRPWLSPAKPPAS